MEQDQLKYWALFYTKMTRSIHRRKKQIRPLTLWYSKNGRVDLCSKTYLQDLNLPGLDFGWRSLFESSVQSCQD